MTTTMTTAMWFHDAIDFEEQEQELMMNDCDYDYDYCCENCRLMELKQIREEFDEMMTNYKYGMCIDCGVGLNYEFEFLVDRRETQCDCFTCDSCFEHFHGKDALHEAVNWKSLGLPIPQFVRLNSLI